MNSAKERRRRAVEAFMDAHYDVSCDAAMELDWFEKHPIEAGHVIAALMTDENRPRAVIRLSATQRVRRWLFG